MTRCFPTFKSPRFTSPRYFFSITPRTRADLGADDFTEQLREMRATFPGQEDYDMVPFLRVSNVRPFSPCCVPRTASDMGGFGGQGNLQEATRLYRACLDWRAVNLPVSRDSCIGSLQKGMFYFHGQDREGRPLGYLTMRWVAQWYEAFARLAC
jgi:hypothetical protein